MNEVISLSNIKKEYFIDGEKLEILKNINLKINEGDFVSITGPSGSGKSTLMNILGFLDKPDSGDYFFLKNNTKNFKASKIDKIRGEKIGFIFQDFNLIHNLTALDNVALPLLYKKIPLEKRKKIAETALKNVGLIDRMGHKPSQLSGGQKQRVAIARATVLKPSIILADEPTGNLDKETGLEILKQLKELNKNGTTIIIITHDKEIANSTKNKIIISDGRIL